MGEYSKMRCPGCQKFRTGTFGVPTATEAEEIMSGKVGVCVDVSVVCEDVTCHGHLGHVAHSFVLAFDKKNLELHRSCKSFVVEHTPYDVYFQGGADKKARTVTVRGATLVRCVCGVELDAVEWDIEGMRVLA